MYTKEQIGRLIGKIHQMTIQNLDEKIIQALANKGFVFETIEERNQFAKERCHVVIGPNKVSTLMVDEQNICQWKENADISMGYADNLHTNKITIQEIFFTEL